MDYAKVALEKHLQWKGKIEIVPTCPVETKDDLSMAYTPGVACLLYTSRNWKMREMKRDMTRSWRSWPGSVR